MNKTQEVDNFLEEKNHPLTDEIKKVREIILQVDSRIEEAIKWKSPTFMYKGNIASYFMNAKKFVSPMFHKGAMINAHLEGDGKEARVARFNDFEDIEEKKDALVSIIKTWIRLQDNK